MSLRDAQQSLGLSLAIKITRY